MKKFLFTLLALMSVLSLKAQVIREGDVFWDGRIRFVAESVNKTDGSVHMVGSDRFDEEGYYLDLKKGNKSGQYFLS